MIVPTAVDILLRLEETLEQVIMPSLVELRQRSNAQTMRHMLHHVAVRIDTEGQVLFDDEKRLRVELAGAADYLEQHPAAETRTHALAAAIRASLARRRDPEVYPSLTLMGAEVAALRQHVCEVLTVLIVFGPEGRGAAGDALREKLRQYTAWQIELEGKVIEPSFVGRGMRR